MFELQFVIGRTFVCFDIQERVVMCLTCFEVQNKLRTTFGVHIPFGVTLSGYNNLSHCFWVHIPLFVYVAGNISNTNMGVLIRERVARY